MRKLVQLTDAEREELWNATSDEVLADHLERMEAVVRTWARANADEIWDLWFHTGTPGERILTAIAEEIGAPVPAVSEVVVRLRLAGPVSITRRWRIFKRDGYACKSCGSDSDLTIDHIMPRSKGGGNEETNLQTMCRTCNCKKGDRT